VDAVEEQIPYTHEFVVDGPYRRALVRGIFASAFRGPWFWVGVSLIVLGAALQLETRTPDLALLIASVVVLGILVGLYYLRMRAVLLRAFPVGTVLRSGYGSTHFVVSKGNDSSRMAYSGFRFAERRGELVWLRRVDVPRRLVLAGALFSDSELALLGSVSATSSADSPRPTPGTPA
jgi:hypothetical protein